MSNTLSQNIIKWYDYHGRKDLPWQGSNAYHVWISEIMLQQTQVIKVIDYFNNFINTFPTLKSLAEAESEQVLACWSGLGYYNRARNLHKTAQICSEKHEGQLPIDLNQLMQLPGIGRTTAGAILSLASDLPYPILDGNVKRVMSRFYKISDEKISLYNAKLWKQVDKLMPKSHCRKYNQALMDLGSMICTRSKPHCHRCPIMKNCKARISDQVALFPQSNKKTKQINKTYHILLLVSEGQIYIEKRNSQSIWPQLWFLPMFDTEQKLHSSNLFELEPFTHYLNFNIKHILTHRKLDLQVHCYKNTTTIDRKITKNNKWTAISQYKKLPHPTALVKIIQYYLANEDT